MKWGLWSTTAASNSSTPPDGWPEGQLPSTVNDCAREMMAQIRTGLNDLQFVDLGVVPTQTGNTTFTMPGNQMQWYQYGTKVKANVGATTLYGTVISASFTTNTGVTLRFDTGEAVAGQNLTNSLSAVSTGFPSPVNGSLHEISWKHKNYAINAMFDIWQLGNGPTKYSGTQMLSNTGPDLWTENASLSAGASVRIGRFERSANASFVPTVAQTGVLLNSSFGISVSAVMAVVNAGSYMYIRHAVEGFNFRNIAQKPITVSFWINSRETGTYALAMQNAGSDRSIVMNYSISSVATWEKKTITFPKSPTAGTWDYSAGVGATFIFTLVAGSSFQGGAGNWTAANIIATSSQVNFMRSAGNVVMIAGVTINEGVSAIPLQPVDINDEIKRVKRQIQILDSNDKINGIAISTSRSLHSYYFDEMRAPPSTAVFPAVTSLYVNDQTGGIRSVSSIVVNAISSRSVLFDVFPVGTPYAGNGSGCILAISAGIIVLVSTI